MFHPYESSTIFLFSLKVIMFNWKNGCVINVITICSKPDEAFVFSFGLAPSSASFSLSPDRLTTRYMIFQFLSFNHRYKKLFYIDAFNLQVIANDWFRQVRNCDPVHINKLAVNTSIWCKSEPTGQGGVLFSPSGTLLGSGNWPNAVLAVKATANKTTKAICRI